MLIDTHAHLTDSRFAGEVEEVLERARAVRVARVVTIGTHVADSRAAVELAARHPEVLAAVGVHPHAADEASEAAMSEIAELARDSRVVALGETGLDYYYDNAPRAAQRVAFARHLELARSTDLPVVVHAREADEDLRSMLREEAAGTRGVLHCFAGGRELLETALEVGWLLSFGGMITFPKYSDAELFRAVPLDRLMLETDSPYLTPVPHRGKRNEPAHVALVARRAAELRGEDPERLAAATTANAERFFGLQPA